MTRSVRTLALTPFQRAAILCALTLGITVSAATVKAATYTIDIGNPLDIGSVVSASAGDTVFQINPTSGLVTIQSGFGRRITNSSVRSTVTVGCKPVQSSQINCQTNNVQIQVGAIGALTGRARALTNFSVAMGTATLVTPPTGTNPITFRIGPIGPNQSKTFYIGADFPVAGNDAGLPSGPGANGFYANITGLVVVGDTDKGRVNAFRALAITKISDVNFGTIQLPVSGTSLVTLNPANGRRTITGNAAAFPTPAPTTAVFAVSGEGGQTFSLSIPNTTNVVGPATLVVALTNTATASPTLSGTLGAGGTYPFNVGGSLSLTPTTPTGAYSGVFVISLDYN